MFDALQISGAGGVDSRGGALGRRTRGSGHPAFSRAGLQRLIRIGGQPGSGGQDLVGLELACRDSSPDGMRAARSTFGGQNRPASSRHTEERWLIFGVEIAVMAGFHRQACMPVAMVEGTNSMS